MSVLQICNCILRVKDEMGNPYGTVSGTFTNSNAELSFYTRKSQINGSDAVYINKIQRAQAQPGVVVQDLLYIALPTPVVVPTVTYTGGGTAGSEVVTVVNTTTTISVSIQIQSGVSTATQIQTAFNASTAAKAVAYCILSGTGTNTQTTVASTTFSSEYCYLALAETTTNTQQGVFELTWSDGSNYDSTIFDPAYIPAQSFQDLSSILTVSRG